MNILIINGSAREQSNSFGISKVIETNLKQSGIDTELFDLRKEELPIFKMEEQQYANVSVNKLVNLSQKADAFFIVTPEYHNGISGALKNCLDFLGIDHFKKKPVAIAAAQGGVVGGFNALNQLRLILRSLHANVLTEQLIINARNFDDKQVIVDETSVQQIEGLVAELIQETGIRLQHS